MFEGIILAGGQSSRMGSDKAALIYEGRSLLDHMRDILDRTGLAPISISGKDGTPDDMPDCGPVGGLCTMILRSAPAQGWLFVPVDMPLLRPALLQRLIEAPDNADAARFEKASFPLLLRNSIALREHADRVAAELREGADYSVFSFLKPLRLAALPLGDAERAQFANLNTPEEWRQFKEQHHESPA